MKNEARTLASFAVAVWLLLAATAGHAQATASPAVVTASAVLHADQPGPQVNRQLFGQFAEHLGAGIYGGIWVGEDSKIPNTRGIPQRRVAGSPRL